MMIKPLLISSAISLVLASGGCPSGGEQPSVGSPTPGTHRVVSIRYFHSALAPYGRWFDDPAYGWCWRPAEVFADWRPYGEGYWVDSDAGWTWVSAEPWGWATDHYGRWVLLADAGTGPGGGASWIWVPGTVWGPAWVAWREGDDWIGWAPLPLVPAAASGARSRAPDTARIPAREWCFVSAEHFMERRLRLSLAPRERNPELLARTQLSSPSGADGERPVAHGPARELIEARTRRPVPHVRIHDTDAPNLSRARPPFGDGTVRLFRPEVRDDRWHAMASPPAPRPPGPPSGPAVGAHDQQPRPETRRAPERSHTQRRRGGERQKDS